MFKYFCNTNIAYLLKWDTFNKNHALIKLILKHYFKKFKKL